MLNWRYVDHPQAGGAEIVTHEVLRRLAGHGHAVTCFTAAHDGAPATSEIDGVRIVRQGRQWSVHVRAWRWLRVRLDEFDRIVDQTNTIPFLTPLYARRHDPTLFIHQLAREYWFRESPGLFKLVAPLGYLAEPVYLRVYRRSPVITVSPSSAADLERLGIGGRGLTIMPQALPFPADAAPAVKAEGAPRIVAIGRLTPAKFVEEAIRAFALLRRRHEPEATMVVAGSGDPAYRRELEALAEREAPGAVRFAGRVDEADKLDLLRDAHLHVFASHREGWGLTVTEAAAVGTPSVGYDAPGVRDSIGDPASLAPIGDVEALSERMASILADPARYETVRRAAWEDARTRTYERTAAVIADALGVPYAAG